MTTPDPTRAAMQQALEALETARAGLQWYREMHPEDVDGSDAEADEEFDAAITALRASISSLAAGEKPPAPPGWWTEELERIFNAAPGQRITSEMKCAAAVALRIARGERWDDERHDWTSAPRGAAGEGGERGADLSDGAKNG